jgi:hypothetical protein
LSLTDHSLRQAQHPFHIGDPWILIGVQHHLCTQTHKGELAVFDPGSLTMNWLLSDQTARPVPDLANVRLSQREFVTNQHYLLSWINKPRGISNFGEYFTNGKPSTLPTTATRWLLYEHGQLSPRQLQADNLPAPENVSCFLIDDQGQVLMMTRKALFRIVIPDP